MRPYAYKSTDFGATWTPVVAPDSPVRGYAHVIKEDLVNPNLLFLGTELGLWVSVDGGKQWAHYKGGDLPAVAVRDLAIHPRDHDLVIGTHGRGIWIVDDISPLRALTPEGLASPVAFLPDRATAQRLQSGGGERGVRRRVRPACPAGDVHDQAHEGHGDIHDAARTRPGSPGHPHTSGATGGARPGTEDQRNAGRHDVRGRTHEWRASGAG